VQKPAKSGEFVKRIVTAAAVLAVAKTLDMPSVAKVTKRVDKSIGSKAAKTGISLKHARRNARQHVGLVLAGVAAMAVAVGLLGRASTK
jgi:hypothetical protein